MGSGDCFKTIICLKKTKQDRLKKVKGSETKKSGGFKLTDHSDKCSNKLGHGASSGKPGVHGLPLEDMAAIQIQTAFRGYKARATLRCLKGTERLRVHVQCHSASKQASIALSYIQSWSKIQAEISARRLDLVTEGRIRRKKQENQLKLEARLHDLQVEWTGGLETMEDILTRLQQREEAAVKRERAMAYAFSHQWRASSGQNQCELVYDFGKGSWGWSWMERWIAGRPWETRLPAQSISPKKEQPKAASKVNDHAKPPARIVSSSVKHAASNGKVFTKRSTDPKQ